MFSGYSFRKFVNANVYQTLDFLERYTQDMESCVRYATEAGKRDIHLDFSAERKDNAIVIWGKDYTTLPNENKPINNETPIFTRTILFEVTREDNISLVTGYYEQDKPYDEINLCIKRIFYAILVNLGARFQADWQNEVNRVYQGLENPEPAKQADAGKTETPNRKSLLDRACIEWVSRGEKGYLGRYTREEFLQDFQNKTSPNDYER